MVDLDLTLFEKKEGEKQVSFVNIHEDRSCRAEIYLPRDQVKAIFKFLTEYREDLCFLHIGWGWDGLINVQSTPKETREELGIYSWGGFYALEPHIRVYTRKISLPNRYWF